MNWLHWLGIELACAWVWVQTLEDTNETLILSFLVFIWSWRVKKKKTLAEVLVKGSWKSKPISELEWSLPPA